MAKANVVEFKAKCPECGEELEVEINEKNLLIDPTEPLVITCDECEEEWDQAYVYDATLGTVTLGEIVASEEVTLGEIVASEEDDEDEDDEEEEEIEDEDEDDEEEENE